MTKDRAKRRLDSMEDSRRGEVCRRTTRLFKKCRSSRIYTVMARTTGLWARISNQLRRFWRLQARLPFNIWTMRVTLLWFQMLNAACMQTQLMDLIRWCSNWKIRCRLKTDLCLRSSRPMVMIKIQARENRTATGKIQQVEIYLRLTDQATSYPSLRLN